MHVTVFHDVVAGDIAARLPTRFKGVPLPLGTRGVSWTVLVIGTGDRVVTASVLSRALAKAGLELSVSTPLLVCGYNFTEEARSLLGAVGALWVAERDFHWTDERYQRVRRPRPRAENADRR